MRLSVISLIFGLAFIAGSADAARLAPEECDGLKSEQGKLVDEGTRSDMQNGPEWAKAKLPAAKLARIKRLIEVEEQIAFRCDRPRVAAAPAATTTAPDAGHAATTAPAAAEEAPAEPPRKGKKARKGKPAAPADAATIATPANEANAAGGATATEPEAKPAEDVPAKPKKGKRSRPNAAAEAPNEAAAKSPAAAAAAGPRPQ